VDEGPKTEGEGKMTGAAGGGRAEVEGRLIRRSLQDGSFRQRLLDDPKAVVEEELGSALPEGVEVRAVEETAQTIYLVLPPATSQPAQREAGELSNRELEGVAGGGTWFRPPSEGC
jgi:Nitrile hydratase, alpha chain